MARSFNGTSETISMGTSATLYALTSMTQSAWVKFTNFTNAYSIVAGVSDASSDNYELLVKSTGKLAFYIGSGANYDGTGSNTLSTGIWYNLVIRFISGTGGTGFVNGGSDGTFAGGSLGVSARQYSVGNQPSFTRWLAGSVADVAVWNVGLSASEILALANGARPYTIRKGSLAGYWPLDGRQSPEPDLSGNRNNGTLTGTALTAGPPVMPFTPRWPLNTDVVAAPTFSPAWARHRNIVEGGRAS